MSDNHINGNGHQSRDAVVKPAGKPLETFRLAPGQTVFARILSDDYKGLFTHYHHKRSTYCPGKECTCPLAKMDRTWKGYCAVEIGKAGSPIWIPHVLEITESLELDFRHVFLRGQIWEIFRAPKIDGKQPAHEGRLHQIVDPSKLRAPFNIVPCVQALYHRQDVEIAYPSPIADRVYVTASEDEPPAPLGSVDQRRIDEADALAKKLAADQERYARNKKSPATANNGRH